MHDVRELEGNRHHSLHPEMSGVGKDKVSQFELKITKRDQSSKR